MREEEILDIALVLVTFALLSMLVVAVIAGNIISQILAPVPSVAGPIGAAVSLFVFVYLVGKGAKLVFH